MVTKVGLGSYACDRGANPMPLFEFVQFIMPQCRYIGGSRALYSVPTVSRNCFSYRTAATQIAATSSRPRPIAVEPYLLMETRAFPARKRVKDTRASQRCRAPSQMSYNVHDNNSMAVPISHVPSVNLRSLLPCRSLILRSRFLADDVEHVNLANPPPQ